MFLNDIVFIDGSLNRHLLTCQRLFKRRRIIYLVLRSIPWRYTVKYFVHLFWYRKLSLQLERNKFLVNKQHFSRSYFQNDWKNWKKIRIFAYKTISGSLFCKQFFLLDSEKFLIAKNLCAIFACKKNDFHFLVYLLTASGWNKLITCCDRLNKYICFRIFWFLQKNVSKITIFFAR